MRESSRGLASLVAKVRRVWREEGAFALARRGMAFAWQRSGRRLMPTQRSVWWSGVCVHEDRALDDWLLVHPRSYRLFDIPDYEDALVAALRELVRAGDRVVIVGGGFGVTSVVAAEGAGAAGRVWSYESSTNRIPWLLETRALNRTRIPMAPIQVVRAHVARSLPATPDLAGAALIEPEALPDCDVLELDCEGGEMDILRGMSVRPRTIIVETHGVFGAPTEAIQQLIVALGYTVLSVRIAEERMRALHEQQDVRVVAAVRNGS